MAAHLWFTVYDVHTPYEYAYEGRWGDAHNRRHEMGCIVDLGALLAKFQGKVQPASQIPGHTVVLDCLVGSQHYLHPMDRNLSCIHYIIVGPVWSMNGLNGQTGSLVSVPGGLALGRRKVGITGSTGDRLTARTTDMDAQMYVGTHPHIVAMVYGKTHWR